VTLTYNTRPSVALRGKADRATKTRFKGAQHTIIKDAKPVDLRIHLMKSLPQDKHRGIAPEGVQRERERETARAGAVCGWLTGVGLREKD